MTFGRRPGRGKPGIAILGDATDPLAPREEIVATALQPDDDDPMMTDDGYTEMTPEFDNLDMLRALENPPPSDAQAQLAPQEAYELLEFEQPVTPDEIEILKRTPFLGPELSWVDDPDHTEWILQRMKEKRGAMDRVLEDQIYGVGEDELEGTELVLGDEYDVLGWGIPGVLKKAVRKTAGAVRSAARTTSRAARTVARTTARPVARAASTAAHTAAHAASAAAHAATSLVKKFVPSRDAGKAKLVKDTYSRLVAGRANFLQMADIKKGVRGKPRSYYEGQARGWAKGRLQAGGLPTTFSAGDGVFGDDVMGSWWNPLSWFQTKVKYVVQNAQGQIAEMSPAEFQAWQQQQGAGAPTDPSAQPTNPDGSPATNPDESPAAPDGSYAAPPPDGSYAAPPPDASYAAPPPDASYAAPPPDDSYPPPPMEAYPDQPPPDYQQGEATMSTDSDDSFIFGDADYDLVVGAEAFSGFADSVLGHHRHHHHKHKKHPTTSSGDESLVIGHHHQHKKHHKPKHVISAGEYRALTMRAAQRASGNPTPGHRHLMAAHERLKVALPARGIAVARPADATVGAWLYKLSPAYWLKSKQERQLVDAEKQNWERTREANKELKAGQRALYQAQEARAAQDQSQSTQAQLAELQQSFASGAVSAIGADGAAAAAEGQRAAAANAKKCGALAAKLEAGQQLTAPELAELRNCLKMCGHLKKLHGALHARTVSGYHENPGIKSDFLGALPAEILGEPVTEILGPRPATTQQKIALTALAATTPNKVPAFLKAQNLVLSANDLGKLKIAVARTKAISKHPQYRNVKMRGDDVVGFSWSKLITAPVAAAYLPAAALAWGVTKSVQIPAQLAKSVAQKGGWYKSSAPAAAPGAPPPGVSATTSSLTSSPAAIAARNARIAAARQRQAAAQARIRAAQSQASAARAEYAAQAQAAQAEADAADAEATAQDMQAEAETAQYDAPPDDDAGDSVLGADFFSGAFVGEVEDEDAKKIVVEAQKNTPVGKKIRAGATLYKRAKGGDKKARLAIAKMQAKANAGDPQAKRDVNAVRAGKIAIHAKGRASTKIVAKARREATAKKIVAVRARAEAGLAARLAEGTRRRKLAHIAKVERLAAHGHPRAKAAVARTVAKARAGDEKAKTTANALLLAKHVRKAAKTPAEAKRIAAAGKVIRKARRGNKSALRTVALIDAAAKNGQPNAKRARARLQVAARIEKAVSSGKVTPPPSQASRTEATRKRYEHLAARAQSGTGTREEALGAAKAASTLGMKQEAAALTLHARELPSAKTAIRDAAAVQAAAEKRDPRAAATIRNTLEAARSGDPKGIAGAGKIAATRAIADVDAGRPMPKPIADATGIVERAHAGDPEAHRIVARVGEAAQSGDPKAVEAAVALTAASVALAATSSNAHANQFWKTKAREARGHVVSTAEQGKVEGELAELMAKLHEGTATYSEGLRARELAMALGNTKLAAQISAIMPPRDYAEAPLSSLPDAPLPQIEGPKGLLTAVIQALTLSTGDPFQNWREGVRSRGEKPTQS